MNRGNEPAYPLPEPEQWVDPFNPSKGTYDANGLTKREYFAGLAMQGILANREIGQDYELEDVPESAVQFADALLAQLNKEAGDE